MSKILVFKLMPIVNRDIDLLSETVGSQVFIQISEVLIVLKMVVKYTLSKLNDNINGNWFHSPLYKKRFYFSKGLFILIEKQ